jgi:glucan biosynthesis protein C
MTTQFQPAGERYHAFDGLRAWMMLLGVVLHSATAYSTLPDVWWLKDPQTSVGFDAFILFIHAFRLPTFFVMSGFFAAMLYQKRGWQGMLENRISRIGLPFLLGMIFMYPILRPVGAWHWFATRHSDPWAPWWAWLRRGTPWREMEPMHLWFLETLMLVILLALPLARRLDRLESGWFPRLFLSRWMFPACALATFVTLLPMEAGILDTPHDLGVNVRVVAAYFVFFTFGWGLWRNRDRVAGLARYGHGMLAVALAAFPVSIWAIMGQLADRGTRHWPEFLAVAASTAVTCWAMIFGLVGLFLRHASDPSPRMRYLSDSAYWFFLVHPLVLVAVQIPMLPLDWPHWLKAVTGVTFAVPVLFWTYDRFVRPTWLGAVLNGRRYARGWPETEVRAGTPLLEPLS